MFLESSLYRRSLRPELRGKLLEFVELKSGSTSFGISVAFGKPQGNLPRIGLFLRSMVVPDEWGMCTPRLKWDSP